MTLNERCKRESFLGPPKGQAEFVKLSGKKTAPGQDSEACCMNGNRQVRKCRKGLKMYKLITNNMNLYNTINNGEFIDGSSLDVLVHVRSLVHLGSKILTHPLCGNLRPNHQPFRSVIIDEISGLVDLESLSLIEDAVRVYQSCKIITPQEIDEATLKDYAFIDSELMKESLIQLGMRD